MSACDLNLLAWLAAVTSDVARDDLNPKFIWIPGTAAIKINQLKDKRINDNPPPRTAWAQEVKRNIRESAFEENSDVAPRQDLPRKHVRC